MTEHGIPLELTPARRWGIAWGAVQVVPAATDLARRPADAVTGREPWWALVIAVNIVGPLSCFRWGREGTPPTPT
ncbi:hypothetical protein LZG04_16395 [Saccharothrix sp. S26]|uniref:hypothetical protein n=1 Tax=Saccharothrix sp. S26 TaxID=2907215 RepID=UPI001F302580|nr:hypothetical protein [Saccharothrix sp. S26]MCE6996366.1 hypothetical protein [Saccharothrix sp. S26]